MAFKDWDNREYYEDNSKCIVCKGEMGKSEELICSATCEDVWQFKSQNANGLQDVQHEGIRWEGWEKEYDCYA